MVYLGPLAMPATTARSSIPAGTLHDYAWGTGGRGGCTNYKLHGLLLTRVDDVPVLVYT